MNKTNWFEVDREGLRNLVERRGHGWLLFEMIQNALDTDADTITVTTEKEAGRPRARISVEDNSSHGFVDLTHAWTMFAPSTKAADPELRGRFNVGEKLFLALAYEATIETTTGTVRFDDAGRHRSSTTKRDRGTKVDAVVRLNRKQYDSMLAEVGKLLPPEGKTVSINGQRFEHREPLGVKERAYLPTEVADDDGRLIRTWRSTTVEFHRPRVNEEPTIFEMGIPVVEAECPWHVNVLQAVPLSIDRDNVTPAYARDLYAIALDTMAETMDEDETKAGWVATGFPAAQPETVVTLTNLRFGDDAVVYDPSTPEANKEALERGRTLIPAAAFDKEGWQAIRRARDTSPGFAAPAGQAIPIGVRQTPDGKAPIPREEWTEGMVAMAEYVEHVAKIADVTVNGVEFIRLRNGSLAWFNRATHVLTFNLGELPSGWTEAPDQQRVDELVIHELAHGKVGDHLTRAFADECCRIGAALMRKTWKGV